MAEEHHPSPLGDGADVPTNLGPAKPGSPLHQSQLHDSGLKHVSGEARYVDDLPALPGTLVAQIVSSPHAHARITRLDTTKALALPGIACVLTHRDIAGENNVGPVIHDEELLASEFVHFMGQSVAVVIGDSYEQCRAGVKAVEVDYEPLPAITTIDAAIEANSWLSDRHLMQRGDVDLALLTAPLRFSGEVRTGGQDHFYLETQCTLAIPEEDSLRLISSTQHPSEVQAIVAHVLNCHRHQVVVEVPRMGGGFGGKETQAAPFAAMAAMAALKTRRPVKVWLNRDQDMMFTGKRHPFLTRFDVGFSLDGKLDALSLEMFSDGGFSNDLSRAILDRGLFHADNAYFIANLKFAGRVARTNLPSNTAFRGFGGPQGMAVIEDIMSRAAERLGLSAEEVRRKNFYGEAPRHITPYHQEVRDNRLPQLWPQLLQRADYAARMTRVAEFNAQSRMVKRGLAITPVKFGISFTTSFLNQAGALVLIYSDGSVQVNHGGTEMGQGLHTKMQVIAAHELGIDLARVRVMTTATDKVPNTSATAASSGADLNGQAVKHACDQLRERLQPVAAKLLGVPAMAANQIVFREGRAFAPQMPEVSVPFERVTQEAYLAQISLSATGYYRTPDISYDRAAGRGKPFHYFAFGAAVSEVEVNGYTGEFRLRRADVLHDAGRSLIPSIDVGQVEGGFIQGLGWLTNEEVIFDARGYLRTHSPDTYKIPASGDAPEIFNVHLLQNAPQENTIHGSKAVGEPPLMLPLSVVAALRHAVSAWGPARTEVQLSIPCTPEAILKAIEAIRH